MCITEHFCTFLCLLCTTTTWKCPRFVEDMSTRQRLHFSFPELRYSLLEFNSRKNFQHLTNWTRWNERDKVWSSDSRRCCLSLISRFSYLTMFNIVLITLVCMHREIAFAEPSTTPYAKRWQRSEGMSVKPQQCTVYNYNEMSEAKHAKHKLLTTKGCNKLLAPKRKL